MDDDLSESVLKVFADLHRKGLIYRGVRMVNWDPQAKTAVSDEEVNHREVNSKLYYVRYKVENEDEYITIATTRPETILGDTAVCVNPADERFKNFHGKKVLVPLINRVIPIIVDEYVDIEFGTGALKITPAHDENDYQLGIKHKLESIDIFNDDGTLNAKAVLFTGEDRFVVRKKIEKSLAENGNLVKIEDYVNKVGYSERTDAVIEPKLSIQWFLSMQDLAGPALENVLNDSVKLHPAKFKNTYRHWMENVKDWCISRQLWWGHRIPAWYYGDNPGVEDYVVALNEEEALDLARKKSGNKALTAQELRQDEDVLDTWFSSWLWPLSVFNGINEPDNKDITYYYPTDDLVTAPEILFFWVARMIIAGYEYRDEKPFKNVYLTGIVRDGQRRKMSKSLGNSPDPLDLIKKFSADGVRVGMLLCSPAGNDLLFDESLTEQGRNFGNKIWNAFRLVKGWEVKSDIPQPASSALAIKWFDARLNDLIGQIDLHYDNYKLSEALMFLYKLFWDDFSSWYLESVKPPFGQAIDAVTYEETLHFFEKLIALLHPFMPFITEEIWQFLRERKEGQSIMISKMPRAHSFDSVLIEDYETLKQVITAVRNLRNEKSLSPKEPLSLYYIVADGEYKDTLDPILQKLANLSAILKAEEKPDSAVSFMIKTTEYYVPLEGKVNVEEELKKLNTELKYTRGFLNSVMKKLSNERFVAGAPAEVIEKENNKRSDAENKIASLEKQIGELEDI